jgi:hypothetical protein
MLGFLDPDEELMFLLTCECVWELYDLAGGPRGEWDRGLMDIRALERAHRRGRADSTRVTAVQLSGGHMSRRMTLTQAFAEFGAKARNIRTAWSARSLDDRTVVVTLWTDRIKDDGNKVVIDCFGCPEIARWRDKRGNKWRTEDLSHAEENCGSKFNVVLVTGPNTKSGPRSAKRIVADKTLVMKLERLNRETGEFAASGKRR